MSVALAHKSTEVAQYTPASALVVGKTLTERKVSVLHGATFEAITYLAGQKGSVGKHARMGLAQFSVGSIATASRRGNYQRKMVSKSRHLSVPHSPKLWN